MNNDQREIWLLFEEGSNRAIVARVGETRTWSGIHYIEHSAYEDLDKKFREVYDSWQSCCSKLGLVIKERDEARAAEALCRPVELRASPEVRSEF
jgi:hypothetical protein